MRLSEKKSPSHTTHASDSYLTHLVGLDSMESLFTALVFDDDKGTTELIEG